MVLCKVFTFMLRLFIEQSPVKSMAMNFYLWLGLLETC